MKLTIQQDQLAEGLKAVQGIIPTRPILPSAGCVLFRAAGGRLELTATDMDMSISTSLRAEVSVEGKACVPASKLLGPIRELGPREVKIETDHSNHTTRITAGTLRSNIHGVSAAEFPSGVDPETSMSFSVSQKTLGNMLKKVAFAICTDFTRPSILGALFSISSGVLTIATTDGRRVAEVTAKLSEPSPDGECVVPTKAISEVRRLLDRGDVLIRFGQNRVSFDFTNADGSNPVRLTSKVIEGRFLPYKQVIPGQDKFTHRVAFNREELVSAVARVAMMVGEPPCVKLAFSENSLEISGKTVGVCDSSETLAVKYKGEPIAIGVNPFYLLEGLRSMDDENIFVFLIDSLSIITVKQNAESVYCVMPMRIE
jgi:DNA polymerase-3 subunit beta